ncbi:hypothetical protein Sjap_008100 [Stephania japonica]|uniref:Uncharacterized protein n=1 Tax=Stephania japonica TaxID=461633 RepID=A0AAP0JPQ4_9MAGN
MEGVYGSHDSKRIVFWNILICKARALYLAFKTPDMLSILLETSNEYMSTIEINKNHMKVLRQKRLGDLQSFTFFIFPTRTLMAKLVTSFIFFLIL